MPLEEKKKHEETISEKDPVKERRLSLYRLLFLFSRRRNECIDKT
jgi:hypothetical protein